MEQAYSVHAGLPSWVVIILFGELSGDGFSEPMLNAGELEVWGVEENVNSTLQRKLSLAHEYTFCLHASFTNVCYWYHTPARAVARSKQGWSVDPMEDLIF